MTIGLHVILSHLCIRHLLYLFWGEGSQFDVALGVVDSLQPEWVFGLEDDHFCVTGIDPFVGVGVEVGPYSLEGVEVALSHERVGKSVDVTEDVKDDGDNEVEEDVRLNSEEESKEDGRNGLRSASIEVIVRITVRLLNHEIIHDSIEALSSRATEESLERFAEAVKVSIFVEEFAVFDSTEQVHPDDGHNKVEKQQYNTDVDDTRHGIDQSVEQDHHLFGAAHQADNTCYTNDTEERSELSKIGDTSNERQDHQHKVESVPVH
mmetsp:Transcript_7279/g.8415  ORF Transcript_7279/g.8415 Transcript_7279/m.8415 type:complete len:264 (-) Transcript_7279:2275-3066(-)